MRAPAEAAEPVLAALLELSPAGVEQVDGDGWVEYALYGAPGELPALPHGRSKVAGFEVAVRGDPVPDDWTERWRRFHRPTLVGSRLWVRPPWEPQATDTGLVDLVIDPGEAFGTGSHPSTRLGLELLLDVAAVVTDCRLATSNDHCDRRPGGALLDLGCGSGVLAIAAAKLGFEPVTAVDLERPAVEATLANARSNGVALERVHRLDVRRAELPAADVVVANLTAPLLRQVGGRVVKRDPEVVLVSGLLDREVAAVAEAFAPLRLVDRRSAGGWSALRLDRSRRE